MARGAGAGARAGGRVWEAGGDERGAGGGGGACRGAEAAGGGGLGQGSICCRLGGLLVVWGGWLPMFCYFCVAPCLLCPLVNRVFQLLNASLSRPHTHSLQVARLRETAAALPVLEAEHDKLLLLADKAATLRSKNAQLSEQVRHRQAPGVACAWHTR